MSLRPWVQRLLGRMAPPGRAEDVLGDLEESHRRRLQRHGWLKAIPDGDVLGHRVRHVGIGGKVRPDGVALRRWYEIVGVVPDFPNVMQPEQVTAKLYQATAPAEIYPATLAIRVRGTGAATFATRLRRVTATLDPALHLRSIRPLDVVYGEAQATMRLIGLGIAIVTLSVLLLSAAGIYAMMSFTVAGSRREIGIRAALGADPRRLLANVFARAATQLGFGIGFGLGAALLLDKLMGGETLVGQAPILLPLVSAIMLAVGLLASIAPARRGLRIQPTEALRQE